MAEVNTHNSAWWGWLDEIFFDEQKLPIVWTDMENLVRSEMQSRYEYIIQAYKDYFMYTKDREAQLEKDWEERRTNVKSPLTYQYTNAAYWMVLDSDIRFTAVDIKWEHEKKKDDDSSENDEKSVTDEMVDFASFLFTSWNAREEYLSALFDWILLWYWYLRDTFVNKKDVVRFKDRMWRPQVVNVNKEFPSIEYVSPFWLFFPPNTKQIDNASFIIERKLMSSTMIKQEYSKYWLELQEKDIKDKWVYISEKDYEAIKINMPFYNNPEAWDIVESDRFNIKDKFLEILEVRTKSYTSIFINGIYHWTWKSSITYDDYPYYLFNFKKLPWVSHSIGMSYVVSPLQKVYDEIINSRQDAVKLSQNKITFVDPKVDMFWKNNVSQLKPWKIYKVSDPQKNIQQFSTEPPWNADYTEVNALFEMIEAAVGISWPLLWTQRKVERSATGSELLKNAALKQMKPLLDSVSHEFSRIMKHWIVNALIYMEDETFDKILWENNKLKNVKVENIINDFDFQFEMLSMKSQSLSVEREQLMQLLQMAGAFTTPDWRQLLDMQKVLDRLLETFNFDSNLKLDPEEFQERLSETQIAKQNAQQEVQQEGWGQQQWWWLQQQLQSLQNRKWNIQRQEWWGWLTAWDTSNPEWSNLPNNQ